ncbi:hypothetical protein QQX98_006384 [Neonectria punicea]|uniref:Uncharacterized protein n=1 Tax=Neonectria punicea TaxID=979145 RepID=A0ABR1H1L5_9HYPO
MFRPVQPLSGAIATKNWLLSVSHFYLWLTFCLQGLKASLLVTDGENSAFIVPWALFAIIVAYGMISLYIMYVIYYLHNRVTGLREEWDVVTIADHLALFRHSNFLDKFEGSCIADRDSMIRALGNLKIKLGYWPREGGNKAPERAEDRNVELSVDKLSTLRYNSVPAVMQPLWLLFLMISAVLMSGGYTAALGLGADQSYTFNVPVSTDIARFLLSFLVTSFSVFFLDYWRNVKLFAVMSQPFVHLDTGGNADETLLLDYTCSHQIVAIYEALGRKHWEVALSSALAILHRGLPILVGASIGVWDENERTLVEFSLPMSVIIIVSMVPSVVFVLYEFFWAGYSRHLPRDYICIADLLSWTCSGHILRTDVVDQSEHGSLRGNPFDNRDGTMAKRWYLEARLRLANLKYRFDLENIRRGRNQFSTMGLTSSTAATGKLRTPGKGLLRRRKKTEACDGGVDTREESFTIAGAGRFKIIDGSESNFVHENSGVGYALTTLQADDRAAAEDTEAAE